MEKFEEPNEETILAIQEARAEINLMKVEDDEFILSVIAEKTKDKTILEELVFKEQDGEVLTYVFENENCSIELKEKINKIKNFKDFLKLNDLKVKDYKLLKKI